jgi:lipopolysaccharide/colanic/teichoic acid biosynthesis glycosyltransferase
MGRDWRAGAALARGAARRHRGSGPRRRALTPTGDAPAPSRPSSRWIELFIVVAALVVAPCVYGLAAFHGAIAPIFKPPVLRHIAFNCAANLAVMWGSLDLKGRLDQRLSDILRRTAILHGALAFFTLIARHYYSIPMLLIGGPISALGGAIVTIVRRRAAAPRLGIVGPWHWIADDRGLECRQIEDPAASIADYDLILITFEGPLPGPWAGLLSRALLAGKAVRHVSEYLEEARGVVAVAHFDIDYLPTSGLANYRAQKRLLDLVCVALLAPLAAPVAAMGALGVWLTMGRPVMFVQARAGLGGEPFRMLKLRTMIPAAPGDAVVATARGDSRITPFGRWLRRFRIDELPQLWNVLVGDMSLIGPRPEQPALAERYTRDVPAFAYRQLVRPGITGWAQVRAGYAADLEETKIKLAYDLFYLKHFTLGLDLQILTRTVWTLLSGAGVR